MTNPGPVIRRLELGLELRRMREAAGVEPKEIAELLRWDVSKVSKLENGARTISAAELDRIAERCGIDHDRTERVHQLAKEARKRGSYGRVQDWARSYVGMESVASELLIHYGDMIPGIMQTKAYAEALLAQAISVRQEDVGRIADSRVARRARLTSENPPELSVILGEPAIRGVVGGGEVMKEQLETLLELARLKHVTLQVLPLADWAHPSLDSSFTIISLAEPVKTILYLEGLTNADYLAGSHHLKSYTLVFNRLRVAALSEHASAALIRDAIETLP
ncbi:MULTISPECIES: helix-turn-helix transcriptional regulator [unclassified Saccharopolyspora]|uniref:helix-turn-helix domain-containing protein n=1 Tax=unclassified Saccharopolyspora TaxID=2646250 RepID=UPI001CD4B199|nr:MULTISPECIES: helix-turn-helix transcriptional regulator [unclassified Saccharopolyspora]MCA1189399.1 helix-turn-helix domain-containing protein [Saccharopolyspora sp. 6T]MCA1191238.1 helix-turn-helix domain-containing protein [Saccharopolyspora sp. 6V]